MNTRSHPRFPLKRAFLSTVISAMACLGAAPALASTITFESLLPEAHESGETLTEAGYNLLLVDGPVAAYYGGVSGTGTILDGNNPYSCDVAGCPSGADGQYLAILNDGAVKLTQVGPNSGFKLLGFDFAFLMPVPVPNNNYGQLQVSGITTGGVLYQQALDFPGQDASGSFTFGGAALTNLFKSQLFASVTINACLFSDTGNCVNSFDDPAFNQAQFLLDNISLGEVPEPASIVLTGLGMAALVWSRRRAVAPAARATFTFQGA